MNLFVMILAATMTVVMVSGCAPKPKEAAPVSEAKKLLTEGTALLKQGQPVQAIQNFASAIKADPNYFEGYYMLGETLIRAKQYTQAEAVMIAAVRQFPDNGLAYYILAIAHQGAGNTVPAIVAARKSVDVFTQGKDQEGQQRAILLLSALVSEAKKKGEEEAIKNAEAAAADAAGQPAAVPAEPPPAPEAPVVPTVDSSAVKTVL